MAYLNRALISQLLGCFFLSLLWLLLVGESLAQQVVAPVIVPQGGGSATQFSAVVNCPTSGAVIRYTTNGAEPTTADTQIVSGGMVQVGRSLTLKAKAWDGNDPVTLTPSDTSVANFRIDGAVAAGDGTTFALRFDGKLLAWGKNIDGRLGNGGTTNVLSPAQIGGNQIGVEGGVENGSGVAHTIMLKSDGTVWCAGSNSAGQLGDNSTVTPSNHLPVQVQVQSGDPLPNVIAVAAGRTASYALTQDGFVYAWGGNGVEKRLGDDTTGDRSYADTVQTAAATPLTDIVEIAAGHDHALALKSDGTLWAWGANGVGQIGDGSTTTRGYAVQVHAGVTNGLNVDAGLTAVTNISAGAFHSVAVLSDGSVIGWGESASGRLGEGTASGTSSAVTRPVQMLDGSSSALANAQAVAGGEAFSLILKTDGTLWACGANANGQLGDGTTTLRAEPVQVRKDASTFFTGVVGMAAGASHGVAIDDQGRVYTWGSASSGELGNGLTSSGTAGYATLYIGSPVTINTPPAITLSVVPEPSIQPGAFTLTAVPTDADGNLSSVSFFQGSTLLGVKTAAPWEWYVSGLSAETYTFGAAVWDSVGASTAATNVESTVVLPTVSVTATTATLAESSGTAGTFTVSRGAGAPISTALNVTYTVTGIATAGTDYQTLSGSVTIPVGETSATVAVTPLTDSTYDPDETVILTVESSAGNYTAGTPASATMTLIDSAPVNAGLRLKLQADKGLVLDGSGNVSTWQDQSGLGNAATQSGSGNRPVPVTNAVNGRPVVRFDGSARYLSLPNVMSGATAGEYFVVLKVAAQPPTAGRRLMNFGGYFGTAYPYSDNQIYDDFGSTKEYVVGTPSQPLTQYHLYSASAQAGSWVSRINGLEQYRSVTNTVSFRTDPVLGGRPGADFFAGDVAEIIVYDQVLTSAQRKAMETYLGTKYGLVGTPSTPASLAAAAIAPTQVSLTWAAASSTVARQFAIERKTGSGAYSEVARVDQMTSYIDSTAAADTTYSYRVWEINYAGASGYSTEATVGTPSVGTAFPTTNIRLWLKADGVSGTSVAVWPDQSGLGNAATQSGSGNRPALVANAINGRPVVRFDGAARYLSLPNVMSGATAGEYFVVIKVAAQPPTAGRRLMNFGGYFGTAYPYSDNQIYDDFGSTKEYVVGTPSQPLTQYHLYSASAQAGSWVSRINGLEQYRSVTNTVSFRSDPVLGGRPGADYFAGDVAEIIVYDQVLTPTQRRAMEAYLGTKYGLVAPPSTPTSLAAAAIAPTQVSLTWTAASSTAARQFAIERKTGSDSYSEVARVDQATSYIDTTAAADTTYSYRVREINYAGVSGYSSEATVVTPIAGPAMPLSNIRLWLKADDIAGTAVAKWPDRSGLGNHANQPLAANQPAVVAAGVNGRPAVRFDGSIRFLALPNLMSGATAGEIFVMVKADQDPPSVGGRMMDFGGDGTGVAYPWTDGVLCDNFGRTPYCIVGNLAQDLSQWHLYNASSKSGEWAARLDGLTQFFTATNSVAFTTNPVLGRSSSIADYFRGNIAEIIIYDQVLTPTQRKAVESYFGQKYIPIDPPVAPTSLAAIAMSPTQINLTWSYTPGNVSEEFIIERKPAGGSFSELGSTVDVSTYVDTTAVAGTSYVYRVKRKNYGGIAYSNDAETATPGSGATLPLDAAIWLSADSGTVLDSTGKCSAWVNRGTSPTGSFSQTSASWRPMVVGSSSSGTGRPVLRFNNSNLQSAAVNLWPSGANYTFFVVTKPGATQNTYSLVFDYDHTASSGVTFQQDLDTTNLYGMGAARFALAAGQWQIASSVKAGSNQDGFVNGNIVSSSASSSADLSGSRAVSIGNKVGNGLFRPYNGDIAEVVLFNRSLTAGERQAWERYLNLKNSVMGLPDSPTGLDAYAVSPSQISLTWNTGVGGTTNGFVVERKASGESSFSPVATLAAAQSSWVDSGRTSATEYTYRIKATNLTGESGPSNEATAETSTAGVNMPLDPAVWLSADVGAILDGSGKCSAWQNRGTAATGPFAQSNVSWRPQFVGGSSSGTGRPVLRFVTSYLQSSSFDLFGSSSNYTVFIVTKPGATQVGSADILDYDHGTWSGLVMQQADPVLNRFGTGAMLMQFATSQWQMVSITKKGTYQQAFFNGSLFSNGSADISNLTGPRALAIGDKVNNSIYRPYNGDIAEVVIFNRNLTSAERRKWELYLNSKYQLISALPGDPSGLGAHAVSATQVELTWAPGSGIVNDYAIERKVGSSGSFSKVGEVFGTATAWIDTSATGSTLYTYRVRAVNRAGESSPTNEVQLKTPAAGVAMPVDPVIWVRGDGSILQDPSGYCLQWANEGSAPIVFEQSDSSRLPLTVSDAVSVPGRPAVRFDGVSDYLQSKSFTLLSGPAYTVFVVTKPGATQVEMADILDYKHGPGSGLVIQQDGIKTNIFRTNNLSSSLVADRWHVVTVTRSSGNQEGFLDGGQNSRAGGDTSDWSGPRLMAIGNIVNNAFSRQYNGDIAELIIFDRKLSDGQRRVVELYLNLKYLPSGMDADGDGLSNEAEIVYGTDPYQGDSNGDGLSDGEDVAAGFSPTSSDVDGDGLSNTWELAHGTDPLNADTDRDGVNDGVDPLPLNPAVTGGTSGDTTPPVITLIEPPLGSL